MLNMDTLDILMSFILEMRIVILPKHREEQGSTEEYRQQKNASSSVVRS